MEIEYIELPNNFKFPIVKNKKIGVSLSAGGDSALLTYILLTYYTDLIYVFTSSDQKDNKHDTNIRSANTLRRIQNLTGNHNVVHVQDYSSSSSTLLQMASLFVHNKTLDVIYTGTNKLPPKGHPHYNSYAGTPEMIKRDPDVIRPQIYSDNVIVPFTNIDKRDINDLYVHFGIRESVLPMTLSCRGKDRVNHCRECSTCEERLYGFGSDYGETINKESK